MVCDALKKYTRAERQPPFKSRMAGGGHCDDGSVSLERRVDDLAELTNVQDMQLGPRVESAAGTLSSAAGSFGSMVTKG